MKKYNVEETAKMFGVTPLTIRTWIKDGLEYSKVKEIGKRAFMVIAPEDVKKYHKTKEEK